MGLAATDALGLDVSSDALRGVAEQRFDAWYGDMGHMAANSDDAIEEYEADFDLLEQQLLAMEDAVEQRDTLPIHRWEIVANKTPKMQRIKTQRLHLEDREGIIPIEIFASDTTNSFDRFIDKLIWGDEVRIAFMGDSFVEGDILTSDLREQLQQTFGGRGVGFVQCDIPFGTVRRTVKRTVSGWNAYSVLKPKNNPASVNDAFFVSGYTARGDAGAKVTWQTTTAFEHLDSCSRARILLSTPDSARVQVKLNGNAEQVREFDLVSVALPQQIVIEGGVDKLEMSVVRGTVDCYGASIEGVSGVIVDNLSMRANSGHAIFGTSAVVNRQIDEYVGYDLVVLQYGLNVMENNRHHYKSYRDKLNEMIAYAKSCFPDAAILVVGVSDRWVKDEEAEVYVRMNSISSMTSYQRAAAEASGAAFWSAADAMQYYGGMAAFVRNSWAAGDYTHINFAGGRRVGEQLYRSIVDYAYERVVAGKSKMPAKRQESYKPIVVEPIAVDIKPFDTEIKFKPVAEDRPAPKLEDEPIAVEQERVEALAESVVEEQALPELTEQPTTDIIDVESLSAEQDANSQTQTIEWDNYQMDIEEEIATESEEEVTIETEPTKAQSTLEVSNTNEEDEFFEITQ